MPFTVSKVPSYAGIVFAGYVGSWVAFRVSKNMLGDAEVRNHLISNRSAIESGECAWEPKQ